MNSPDRKIEDARDVVAVKKATNNPTGQAVEVADSVKFLSAVSFSELPESPVLLAQKSVTTFSVLNTTRVRMQNTGSVTVTNFTDGQEGQQIAVRGDGFTSVTHNTNIRTNTAATKLLAVDGVYAFTRINNQWVESAAASTSSVTPKCIDLIATQVSFVTIGSATDQPFPGTNIWASRTDTVGYNTVRFSGIFTCTGPASENTIFGLYYSTNAGGSWTAVGMGGNSGTLIIDTGVSNKFISDVITLPAGAKNAATWLRPYYLDQSVSQTVSLSGVHLELLP